MRFSEILNESPNYPLYHGTRFDTALSILKHGYIDALTGHLYYEQPEMNIDTPVDNVICTSRKMIWKLPTTEPFSVIFVLNREMIKTRYKIIPYDYYGSDEYLYDDLGEEDFSSYYRFETEERIFCDKLPLKFIKAVYVDSDVNSEEIFKLCELKNIPCFKITKNLISPIK
jgi:hypothetical protein